MVVTLSQQYNVGEKPTVILYHTLFLLSKARLIRQRYTRRRRLAPEYMGSNTCMYSRCFRFVFVWCPCMACNVCMYVCMYVFIKLHMYVCMYVCMYGHHIYQSMDQAGKVANPARGHLRKIYIPLSPCVLESLVSRDGFNRPVPRQPAHLHTQAESGAYLRDSPRVPRRHPFMKPPYAIGSVPSLSGHAIAYRWRSLPRVRRLRAGKPQGSS